ncbi:molybdenum cofactor biosynthesis protein MoaE, partial [Campylobacter sp. MOP51]
MEIYEGSLEVEKITNAWYNEFKDKNCGAFITFVGIVREEGGIS